MRPRLLTILLLLLAAAVVNVGVAWSSQPNSWSPERPLTEGELSGVIRPRTPPGFPPMSVDSSTLGSSFSFTARVAIVSEWGLRFPTNGGHTKWTG